MTCDKCGYVILDLKDFYVVTNMWCCPKCPHILAYSKWEAEDLLKLVNKK